MLNRSKNEDPIRVTQMVIYGTGWNALNWVSINLLTKFFDGMTPQIFSFFEDSSASNKDKRIQLLSGNHPVNQSDIMETGWNLKRPPSQNRLFIDFRGSPNQGQGN